MKEDAKELVKKLVRQYIKSRPKGISLKLSWNDRRSRISLVGDGLNKAVEYYDTIPFSLFASGVIEACEEVYGKLKVVPVSFREDIYENDKVSLDLYPTGGLGVFNIYVKYEGEWVVSKFDKLIRRMFAPIIVFRGFKNLVTEEMKTKITIERLKDPFSQYSYRL